MNDFEYCRKIHQKFGKGYYFATRFFPKHVRLGTHALYAWTRIPDDIVDIERNKDKLMSWISDWRKAEKTGISTRPEMNAMLATRHKFNIPEVYNDAFLQSMLMDFEKRSYLNINELNQYMYGSATSVGIMMMYIFGDFKNMAIPYATAMAEAMQLTNFLRDIKEDYETKNIVYLPLDEMQAYGLSEINIKTHNIPREFIIFKIKQARHLFIEAKKGIPLLPKMSRYPILLAGNLYEAILDEIEKQDYNVFIKRARTNIWQKIIISIKTYIWYRRNM